MRYLDDPDAIYAASFAAIRREAPIDRLPEDVQGMALRLVHACGMPDILDDLAFTGDAVAAGRRALAAGAQVLVDARMVAAGVRPGRLPSGTTLSCMLDHPDVAALAARRRTTRSAAGVDAARGQLDGAVIAIGNAPTALFRLLELLEDGVPAPALVLAFPVGFVGASESKAALIARAGVPYVTLRGRRGGSAMAAAALNALIPDRP